MRGLRMAANALIGGVMLTLLFAVGIACAWILIDGCRLGDPERLIVGGIMSILWWSFVIAGVVGMIQGHRAMARRVERVVRETTEKLHEAENRSKENT